MSVFAYFLTIRQKNPGSGDQAGPNGCWNRCHGRPDGKGHSYQTGHYWSGEQVYISQYMFIFKAKLCPPAFGHFRRRLLNQHIFCLTISDAVFFFSGVSWTSTKRRWSLMRSEMNMPSFKRSTPHLQTEMEPNTWPELSTGRKVEFSSQKNPSQLLVTLLSLPLVCEWVNGLP